MRELMSEYAFAGLGSGRELSLVEEHVLARRERSRRDRRAQRGGSTVGVDPDPGEIGSEGALHPSAEVAGERIPGASEPLDGRAGVGVQRSAFVADQGTAGRRRGAAQVVAPRTVL